MLEVVILAVTIDNKIRLKVYKLTSVIKLILIYLLSRESAVANRDNSNVAQGSTPCQAFHLISGICTARTIARSLARFALLNQASAHLDLWASQLWARRYPAAARTARSSSSEAWFSCSFTFSSTTLSRVQRDLSARRAPRCQRQRHERVNRLAHETWARCPW
jgi:hypothetical protein